MSALRVASLARLAAGAVGFAARRPGAARAASRLSDRIGRRAERFRATLESTVWSRPESPWRRLLVAAGVEPGDVERLLRGEGVEGTLAELARHGVRASVAELRGLESIRRGSLVFAARAEEFHNPRLAGAAIAASTSGTTGPRLAAPYGWRLFAEEADAERLLFEAHGLARQPVALWYPALPGIAGLHNAMLHWRGGRAVSRWFSHTPAPSWREAPMLRLLHEGISALGALRGSARARHLPLERAVEVAEWLAEGVRRGERRVLKTFASSAVRVAGAARAAGLDLGGQVVFAGGEPLTSERRRALAEVGLAVWPRYAATEVGIIAGACAEPERAGAMHLYLDRLAVLAGGRPAAAPGAPGAAGELAFTSLAPSAPLVLINADLGDTGALARCQCGCALGAAGCDQVVGEIASPGKFAAEGIKLLAVQAAEAAAAAVGAAGGGPDDVQVRWRDEGAEPARLVVAISPRLDLDLERLELDLLAGIAALAGGSLAGRLWREAGTLRVVREEPRPGAGAKAASIVEECEVRP